MHVRPIRLNKWDVQVYWNSPTARCLKKFNVTIPIETYSIVGNKNQEFVGEKVS